MLLVVLNEVDNEQRVTDHHAGECDDADDRGRGEVGTQQPVPRKDTNDPEWHSGHRDQRNEERLVIGDEQEIDCGQRSAERHQHVAVDIERHAHSTIPKKLVAVDDIRRGLARSEEHTCELQSLMRISYAVFCLKNKYQPKSPTNQKEK